MGEFIVGLQNNVEVIMWSVGPSKNKCLIDTKFITYFSIYHPISSFSLLEHITNSSFNLHILTISDEKPIVVLTHGDLLSLSDRTRIRMHLGQLLGIHPKKQIFDIPGDIKIT